MKLLNTSWKQVLLPAANSTNFPAGHLVIVSTATITHFNKEAASDQLDARLRTGLTAKLIISSPLAGVISLVLRILCIGNFLNATDISHLLIKSYIALDILLYLHWGFAMKFTVSF
jgi:hypothetical protein